jgi:hypothetical protein
LANCESRLSQTFSNASSDPFFTRKRFMAMNILLSFLMHRAVFAPSAGVLTAARWLSGASRRLRLTRLSARRDIIERFSADRAANVCRAIINSSSVGIT